MVTITNNNKWYFDNREKKLGLRKITPNNKWYFDNRSTKISEPN
jgi:uncharacterized protein YneR